MMSAPDPTNSRAKTAGRAPRSGGPGDPRKRLGELPAAHLLRCDEVVRAAPFVLVQGPQHECDHIVQVDPRKPLGAGREVNRTGSDGGCKFPGAVQDSSS